MTRRPRLGLGVIRGLIELASAAGGVEAEKFCWQALATEALGLLHLLAYGPTEYSSVLRTALFTGESLPKALASLGVGRRGHRAALLRTKHGGNAENVSPLSELPVSGIQFLKLQKLLSVWHRAWPENHDWGEFVKLAAFFDVSCSPADSYLLDAMTWAWSGHGSSDLRLKRLMNSALRLCELCNRFGTSISIETAMQTLMRTVPNASALDGQRFDNSFKFGVGQVTRMVAGLARIDLEELTHPLWAQLPMFLPAPSDIPVNFSLVRSLDQAVGHGLLENNCLARTDMVIDYCCGAILFKMSADGSAVGTLALNIQLSDTNQVGFSLCDISGLGNLRPDPPLVSAAQSFAATLRFFSPDAVWRQHLGSRSEFVTKMGLADKKDLLPLQPTGDPI